MLENDLSPAVKPSTIYLKDYQVPDFFIEHIKLDAKLGESVTVIESTLSIKRNGKHHAPLVLNGEKMTLLKVAIDGAELFESDYQLDQDSLTIESVADVFELCITTELQPHLNTELSGLYQSSGNFCTQCEAEGFRRITYFLDRPDVLTQYDVTITANKQQCPVLLSNGNLVGHGDNDDGTHWVKWHDPHPKPCYLFALVAGDLEHISDRYTTSSGSQVDLHIYTQAHNIDKCAHAMASLIASMRWDEQVYGREYDLAVYNIVAVDDFNMGAMENKGLNIFNSKYVLANQQTATDSDFEGIESVIAHEYFHNWSGNRVTCRDWFQLSLKEGFTVFRDQEFSADMNSRAVKRIRDVQLLRAHQFKEDAGPMAHPVRPDSYQEINNFYTVTIYEKGAEVIRMMHSMVGKEGFRKATDLYFDRHDGQAVTTEDFVNCIEQANDLDLTQFRLWYTQSGTPHVHVDQTFDNGVLSLNFSQHCPATPGQKVKQAFQIPIAIALFTQQGDKLSETTLMLEQETQCFEFSDFDEPPVVSMLRDFSAPIRLNFEQSDDELAALVRFDDNGFTRWEAVQRLILNVLLPEINNQQADLAQCASYQRLLTVLNALLERGVEDKAVFSEMLSLPSATYLAELCSPINPQRIVDSRERLLSALAIDLEALFLKLYQENSHDSVFSLDAQAMARRALKNTALHYLVVTKKEEHYSRALNQYYQATNMTDRLAAFACLANSDSPDRQTVISDFEQQWQHDTLVMDKWFAIQAMGLQDNVLNTVKSLMQHAAFSMNNPNKVRSLIGAFAGNLRGFHQTDGAGYRLLADTIIELNGLNPQVAARLAGVFNSWRAYADPYSHLMHQQLQRISACNNLTKDVTEIVSKALRA